MASWERLGACFGRQAAGRAARQEATRAETARARTRAALDEVSSEAIETLLSQQPELTDRHKAFLHRALELYAEFAEDSGTEPEARAEVARAHLRMGNIRTTLGELADAELAYDRATTLLAPLAAEFPDVTAYSSDLAKAQLAFGVVLYRRADRAGAENRFRIGVELLEALHKQHADVAQLRPDWPKSSVHLANVLADRAEQQDAEAGYRRAISLLEPLSTAAGDGEVRVAIGPRPVQSRLAAQRDGPGRRIGSRVSAGSRGQRGTRTGFPQSHDFARRLSSCLVNLSGCWPNAELGTKRRDCIAGGSRSKRNSPATIPPSPSIGSSSVGPWVALRACSRTGVNRVRPARCTSGPSTSSNCWPASTPTFPITGAISGSIYNNFAFFELGAGHLAERRPGSARPWPVQEPLVHSTLRFPSSGRNWETRTETWEPCCSTSRHTEAEQVFRQVLEQNEELLSQFPEDPAYLLDRGAE